MKTENKNENQCPWQAARHDCYWLRPCYYVILYSTDVLSAIFPRRSRMSSLYILHTRHLYVGDVLYYEKIK